MAEESKFLPLDAAVQEQFDDILKTMYMPRPLDVRCFAVAKQKALIKISKAPDVWKHMTHVDIVVCINEDYAANLDKDAVEILIRQELDRVQLDPEKDTVKIGGYEVTTSVAAVKKYGLEAVARANKLLELYQEQQTEVAKQEAKDKRRKGAGGGHAEAARVFLS